MKMGLFKSCFILISTPNLLLQAILNIHKAKCKETVALQKAEWNVIMDDTFCAKQCQKTLPSATLCLFWELYFWMEGIWQSISHHMGPSDETMNFWIPNSSPTWRAGATHKWALNILAGDWWLLGARWSITGTLIHISVTGRVASIIGPTLVTDALVLGLNRWKQTQGWIKECSLFNRNLSLNWLHDYIISNYSGPTESGHIQRLYGEKHLYCFPLNSKAQRLAQWAGVAHQRGCTMSRGCSSERLHNEQGLLIREVVQWEGAAHQRGCTMRRGCSSERLYNEKGLLIREVAQWAGAAHQRGCITGGSTVN